MKTIKQVGAIVGVIALMLSSLYSTQSIAAEKFPSKTIEMTILFGGTAKSVGDLVAKGLEKELKGTVVAISRTGGGGAVGYQHIQSKPATGYDIVWNSNSVSTAYYSGAMPFDHTAFAPIAGIISEVPVLAVKSGTFKTIQDLAAFGKKNPGKIKVGISGKGAFTHLSAAVIFDALGVEVTYIPYGKGSAPTELLAGRIDAAVQWPGQFRSFHKAKQLTMLAVTSPKRITSDKDIPSMQELGFKSVDVVMWRGLAAKKGTPKNQIQAIEAAAAKYVNSAEFKSASEKIGFEIAYLNTAAFAKKIAEDDQIIKDLTKKLGLSKN